MKQHILKISPADTKYIDILEKLLLECNDYEPFLDCNTPYFLAFSDSSFSQCIGFLSFLVNDLTETEIAYEAELTAFVLPEFRRKGVFSSLAAAAQTYILNKYKNCKLTGVFPNYLRSCSLCGNTAYKEYLMILSKENAKEHIHSDFFEDNDNFFECCFSDDRHDFLLYRNDEDEPCAVCSLDYGSCFTNLYGVYVDENCRHRGLGRLLVSQLISDYFAQSDFPIILNVRSTNTAALRLYRHCGFEIQSSVEFCFFTVLQL